MINKNIENSSHLENLDMFGLNFNFKVDGNEKFQTKFGTFLTIFYILFSIGLFLSFGQDLYLRRNPKVIYNSKVVSYEEENFSNRNFTFAFRIEDIAGNLIVNDSNYSFDVSYFQMKLNDKGEWENILLESFPFRRCQELNYTKQKEEFYNFSLAYWFCFDFDFMKLGGYWDGNFIYGLNINTRQCQYSKNN